MLRISKLSFFIIAFLIAEIELPATLAEEGIRPVDVSGRPLNLDFELGTLKDWESEGNAFEGQPVKGDTVASRRGDMKSRHQGQFWIGTFEKSGDKPQGTLTSASFRITHRWASFLIGGGPHQSTAVELVLKGNNEIIHRFSGNEEEDLKRELVDLNPFLGKDMFIRLVDRHSGHWGHINFDDFRFYSTRPNFSNRPKSLQPDVYKHAGLSPKRSAELMTVPPGFKVTLFAGEPDVNQPIAMCLDDRGRVWVAEAYSYPIRRIEKEARDRIVIFEDTNGDGVFDKRTIFMDKLNLVSGLEVGFGGVWIGAAPYLLFVPVKPGEDKPSGPAKILLDGWGYQDTHETLNTFSWGPDGWLYGCHGVFTHSKVGKPGTPDSLRTPINAGVWRYHPTKHEFEVFAHGTSNPWGLDFNDWGQAFVEACVIPHNWHIIQNARYHRQAGSHFNSYSFDDIKTIAVHRHYLGPTPHSGNEKSDSVGGGHAHCGTMIYLGDTWPAHYRNQMFMGNIHGRRLNVDSLSQKGSGWIANRSPDFLLANDAWARFINLQMGPDGNTFLIDWYDKQACHHGNPNIWDRESGRIYKISYGEKKATPIDLSQKNNKELVDLQLHANDWYVRHSRRLLQERKALGILPDLEKIAFNHSDETRRLRGLWAIHAVGGMNEERILHALNDSGAFVRGWTVQLACESKKISKKVFHKFEQMAKDDPSSIVRLYLASNLQRLPLAQRWTILNELVQHGEDSNDHNLPLMYWYAMEPLAEIAPERAINLAAQSKIPIHLGFMVRRISLIGDGKSIEILVKALGETNDHLAQLSILQAIDSGLKGQRRISRPQSWQGVGSLMMNHANKQVKEAATALAIRFGDPKAIESMKTLLMDRKSSLESRQRALYSLEEARESSVVELLQEIAENKDQLQLEAIRSLASFEHSKTPNILLKIYPSLDAQGKRSVLATLASRGSFGKALMTAVSEKRISGNDLSADLIRQLRKLEDANIEKQITEVWGQVRTTPLERKALIEKYSATIKNPKFEPDLSRGRAVFNKVCAQCHTLFGEGGKLGPDITGANRASLDYLLENILDPSGVIPKEYAMSVFLLTNGRVISGIVREENDQTIIVATQNETLTVLKKDVEKRELSSQSMMPDDIFKNLSGKDIISLVAYLQTPLQVPLLATSENAKVFFNGKDLTGWVGDNNLWHVNNGEIVGSSPGLRHNQFLKSKILANDFRLRFKVKLSPNQENSGVQFRSEELPKGEMKGPQADIGQGWWGKLYEENGRGLLWSKNGDSHVKKDDWNDYVIEAKGTRVRTWINGHLCVDLEDAKISRRGSFAFQLHSGGKMEVRFKDLDLEVIDEQ